MITIPVPSIPPGSATFRGDLPEIPRELVKDLKRGEWFVFIVRQDAGLIFCWRARLYRMVRDGVAPAAYEYHTNDITMTRWGARRRARRVACGRLYAPRGHEVIRPLPPRTEVGHGV